MAKDPVHASADQSYPDLLFSKYRTGFLSGYAYRICAVSWTDTGIVPPFPAMGDDVVYRDVRFPDAL